MSNPYQTPAFDPRQFQDQPVGPGAAFGSNWVGQVRIFSVLNAVQGMFEILMGLLVGGMGVLLPAMSRMKEFQEAQGNEAPPEQFFWVFGGIYLVLGVVTLASGILRIVAGIQNYRFKGRVLGLISIIAGVAPVFTCYCAPSAIGMLVYGLIIHLDPAVVAAFQMAKEGKDVSHILAAFSPYPSGYYSSPPSGSAAPPN